VVIKIIYCDNFNGMNFQVGDRVYTVQTVSGSYAEFSVAEECHTFKLHEDLTFAQGAALGIPYFTAYRALFIELVSLVHPLTLSLLLAHIQVLTSLFHDVWPSPSRLHYIYICGGCCPVTEFCQVQNSVCVLLSLALSCWQRYCTALEQWA